MGWFGGGGSKKDKKGGTQQKENDGVEHQSNGGEQETSGTAGNAVSAQAPKQQKQQVGPSAADVSVFEFGSAQAHGDERLTLAGYCPVSDETEPCRWEVFPAGQTEAPGFRILF